MKISTDVLYSKLSPIEIKELADCFSFQDIRTITSISFKPERRFLHRLLNAISQTTPLQGTNETNRGRELSEIAENVINSELPNVIRIYQEKLKDIKLLPSEINKYVSQLDPVQLAKQDVADLGDDEGKDWEAVAYNASIVCAKAGRVPLPVDQIVKWTMLNVENNLITQASERVLVDCFSEQYTNRFTVKDSERHTAFFVGGMASGKSFASEILMNAEKDIYGPDKVIFCNADHFKYVLSKYAIDDEVLHTSMEKPDPELGLWVHNESTIVASRLVKELQDKAQQQDIPNCIINMTFPGQREIDLALERNGHADVFLITVDPSIAKEQESIRTKQMVAAGHPARPASEEHFERSHAMFNGSLMSWLNYQGNPMCLYLIERQKHSSKVAGIINLESNKVSILEPESFLRIGQRFSENPPFEKILHDKGFCIDTPETSKSMQTFTQQISDGVR